MNKAIEYIQDKKLEESILYKYRIGVIEEKNNLISFNFPNEGVSFLKKLKKKEIQDGVVIPYFSLYNILLGLAVRLFNNPKMKYDGNSFKKSEHLYNLNNVYKSIIEKGYVIFVEGYFDVLGLVNVGIDNVVAICGSSLSLTQLYLIRRFCTEIILMLDGDKVGFTKSKVIETFIKRNSDMKCNVVYLPDGLDPDDFIQKQGKDKLVKLIEGARNG